MHIHYVDHFEIVARHHVPSRIDGASGRRAAVKASTRAGYPFQVVWQTDRMSVPAFEYFRDRAGAEQWAARIVGK